MRYFFQLILVLCALAIQGQDFNNYQPLVSEGQIPIDFRKLTSQKYAEDLRDNKATLKNNRSTRRDRKAFLLKSNYLINELLLSGKVLFNDPVSNYVNRVADQLLDGEPRLREKLRFYVLKSSVANAFATDQGLVFITLGMLAKLQNESQLAYILSHEIAHFDKKHNIESHIERKILSTRLKGHLSSDDKIRAMSSYSKEVELEADSLGLIRFLKSNYSREAVLSSFDVLHLVYLPFEDVPFDFTFLETEHLRFPQHLKLDSVTPLVLDDNYNDEYSSHPNIKRRKDRMSVQMAGLQMTSGSTYLVSAEEFKLVRKIARYELLRLYILDRNYGSAIYNAFILSRTESNGIYNQLCVAKSLYALAKYKNNGRLGEVLTDYRDVVGESQSLLYMLRNLDHDQLNTLAHSYIWDLYNCNIGNPHVKALKDEMFKTLVLENKMSSEEFFKTEADIAAFLAKEAEKKQETKESTYDGSAGGSYEKIEIRTESTGYSGGSDNGSTTESKDNFHRSAFISEFKNPNFRSAYDALEIELEAAERKRLKDLENEQEIRRENAVERRNMRRHGASLGIPKIIIVDPFFLSYDQRTGMKYIDSEDKVLFFRDLINDNAKKADIDIEFINSKKLESGGASTYNDMSLLKDWMVERLDHEDIAILPTDFERIQDVTGKFNSDYVLFTGAITVRETKDDVFSVLLYSILLYPLLPYGIWYAVTPQNHSFYFSLLFNLKTGETVFSESQETTSGYRKDLLNSRMFDQLNQFKRTAR